MPRKVAFLGEKGLSYSYSGITHEAVPWTPIISKIREKLGWESNCVLANLYRDGKDSVAYHSDDEKGLNPTIMSVSFGGSRRFLLKEKSSKRVLEVILEDGSLLVMGGNTQLFWEHSIPKTKKKVSPRINLTFRKVDV